MSCFHPLKAFRDSSGVRVLPADAQLFNLRLPCGQCVGCRLERSRQWALRCIHEASLHEFNCFVTLTYDDAHVPEDGGLHHRDFQLFMKRLRKSFPDFSIRYYMCGEYGGDFGRPHFHVILFNHTFSDLTLWRKSNAGSSLFRSATLEQLWPFGFSSIGAVTFESAAYVARYVMKKVTGSGSSRHYETLNESTGEIHSRRPEYNGMSLKPGIGADWYKKFSSDVFPHDRVVHDGTPSKPPRYYDKLLGRSNPDLLASIKSKRVLDNESRFADNTIQRLASKELVTKASISKLVRGFS
jgi:hypothetical protein